jgi:hypothetical protein
LDGGKDISILQWRFEIQAISNKPSLDKCHASVPSKRNCSASGLGPQTVDNNDDILANCDAHGAGGSSNKDLTSDDSSDEVLSSSPN